MIALLLFLVFIISIDVYSFFGLHATVFAGSGKWFYISYFSTTFITVLGIFLLIYSMISGYSTIPLYVNLLFGMAFSFVMAKLFMASLFLIEDIFRGFILVFQSALRFRLAETIHRSFLAGISFFSFGVIMILIINSGVWIGRYHFKVRHKTLEFANLPPSFDGFKIAQISDFHLGTFDQIKRVQKGFDKLQQQNPDLILFTGDMVNNRVKEVIPFFKMIQALHAPYGKFSILGNHDYGDYVHWKTQNDRIETSRISVGFYWII
jgi:uncharacterized protein